MTFLFDYTTLLKGMKHVSFKLNITQLKRRNSQKKKRISDYTSLKFDSLKMLVNYNR